MPHTPGPWAVLEGDLGTSEKLAVVHHTPPLIRQIADVRDRWNAPTDEDKANARLIAAAPEMLEALKGIRSIIENSDKWWMDCPEKGGFDTDPIDAVIAKAEGR